MREDWIDVDLGELCDFIGGGTPSKSKSSYWGGEIPWASIKDIKGDELIQTRDFISIEGLENSASNMAQKGEIILATRINPGRPILARIDTAINQDLKIVKPRLEVDIKYLFYGFKTLERFVLQISSGTTVMGINLTNLKSINFSLAPLPEQRAIVAKIEELFSDLDKGIADLKKAQAQLVVYRQAVLKKAFEGELTNTKMKHLFLSEISSKLGDGLHGTPNYSENGEYFFINGNNLNDGKIWIKPETKRVSESEYLKYKKELNNSTILVSINGTIGNTSFFNNEPVILGKSACYFNVIEGINKRYVRFNLLTSEFINYAIKNATGSTIKNVGLKTMRNYKVPIPINPDEQHQIVKEIESRLSVCDQVERSITESLEKSKALRQSILKKAFEGTLLSVEEIAACKNAEDYEPAGVLLARIERSRNERNKKEKKK